MHGEYMWAPIAASTSFQSTDQGKLTQKSKVHFRKDQKIDREMTPDKCSILSVRPCTFSNTKAHLPQAPCKNPAL